MYGYLAIPLAYFIGAIPTAYLVTRFIGKTDLRTEGDGRISAAAVYRRLGKFPYALVVLIDVGWGVLAIVFAKMLSDSLAIWLCAGFAAMIGHNWPVYMKFKGGLGATAMGGVLATLMCWQIFTGVGVGIIVLILTRRSGLSTIVTLATATVILLIQYILSREFPVYFVAYPLILAIPMFIKRIQRDRAAAARISA
jgi:glycerol-3-phosphate acyltransferase PlsY